MSIPRGAKWVYEAGRKVGVILSDGRQVSRGEGERLGARESGYKNPSQERKNVAERKGFLKDNERFEAFRKRAVAHAKATGKKVDPRKIEAAYWRLHVSGSNFRHAKGTRQQVEAQLDHQRAMQAAGNLTGRAPGTYIKSGDTP